MCYCFNIFSADVVGAEANKSVFCEAEQSLLPTSQYAIETS